MVYSVGTSSHDKVRRSAFTRHDTRLRDLRSEILHFQHIADSTTGRHACPSCLIQTAQLPNLQKTTCRFHTRYSPGTSALGRFFHNTVGFRSANAGCGGVVPTGTGKGLAAVAGAGLAAAAGAGVAATGAGLAAVAGAGLAAAAGAGVAATGAGLAAGIGAGLAAAAGASLAAAAGAGLAVVAGAASALWHARRHCVRM